MLSVRGGGIMNDEILKRQGAAEFLKTPIGTIDYLVATGQIPYFRVGKRNVRFSRQRLLEWIKEREGIEFRHKKRINNEFKINRRDRER